MAQIAFLGTGLLGGAFAEAAATRGDSVEAWNRTPDKVQALARFGVQPVAAGHGAKDPAVLVIDALRRP